MALFLVGEQWRGSGNYRPAVPLPSHDLRDYFESISVNPEVFWNQTRIGYLETTWERRFSVRDIFQFQNDFLESFRPEDADFHLRPDYSFLGRIDVLEEEAQKLLIPTIFPLIRSIFLQTFTAQLILPRSLEDFQKLLEHTKFRLIQQNLKIAGFQFDLFNDGTDIYYMRGEQCVRIPDIKWFCNELLSKFELKKIPKTTEEFYNLAIPAMALGYVRPEKFLWKKKLERKYGRRWRDSWVLRSMNPDRDGILFRRWKEEMLKLGYVRV